MIISAASKRRRQVAAILSNAPPPVLVTHPVIVSGLFEKLDGYSWYRAGSPGIPITVTPGTWSGAVTVTRGWYQRIPPLTLVRVSGNDVLSYTPTDADRTASTKYQWMETAISASGKKTVRILPIITINTPRQFQPSFLYAKDEGVLVRGYHGPGLELLPPPNPSGNWFNPVSGDMTVTGQWVKNDVETGVTAPVYSDTQDGDIIKWRSTATNLFGSASRDTGTHRISAAFHNAMYPASQAMHAAVIGKAGAPHMNVFSVKNHATQTYVRNPDVWCAPWVPKLTGIAAYKASLGSYESYGNIMITPRHMLRTGHAGTVASKTWSVNHYAPFDATTRFVKVDGTVVNRQQMGQYKIPDLDLSVAVLDEPVPEGIHVIPLIDIPWSWFTDAQINLYSMLRSYDIPLIVASQGAGRGTRVVPPIPVSDYPQYNDSMFWTGWMGSTDRYKDLDYAVWDGDSGTPATILYGDTLYLYTIVSSSGISGNIPRIIEAIDACDADCVARHALDPTQGFPQVTGLRPTVFTPVL
jgi:hypothetical protein